VPTKNKPLNSTGCIYAVAKVNFSYKAYRHKNAVLCIKNKNDTLAFEKEKLALPATRYGINPLRSQRSQAGGCAGFLYRPNRALISKASVTALIVCLIKNLRNTLTCWNKMCLIYTAKLFGISI
jgi:hypothetical protein